MTTMDQLFADVCAHLVSSGKRILKEAGKIKDIGVAKADLTEEDLRIERELTKLIHDRHPDHYIYAEEEHDAFREHEHVWVIDPISGTDGFISGFPHFGLVAAYLHKGRAESAAVYDPSVDELFTARLSEGTFLNGERVGVSTGKRRVIYNLAKPRVLSEASQELWPKLCLYDVHRNANSFAVNYCWVACGRYDGVVTLAKDSFTEYAGSLIITEAGGVFTNSAGAENFLPSDRLFAGGSKQVAPELLDIIAS
jgi:myo-inositol-1(or 4)-monophosphatase